MGTWRSLSREKGATGSLTDKFDWQIIDVGVYWGGGGERIGFSRWGRLPRAGFRNVAWSQPLPPFLLFLSFSGRRNCEIYL